MKLAASGLLCVPKVLVEDEGRCWFGSGLVLVLSAGGITIQLSLGLGVSQHVLSAVLWYGEERNVLALPC